ncbi:outer membrane receptor protein involved in Fe transport [Algoriphagus sp. 4150]|uniref:TonB-dependent receptor domain-containing protein n=1 Tax=Algoriphagus sp. 4150 TaxID=2817756 RepID=UPI00285E5306|nr:TonB-dependent receptor [Algoriphagus sp. 4150]MDR7131558.1 outer membrane receptor protein involved in Fe transport [Algoriphagus sp. 4150]
MKKLVFICFLIVQLTPLIHAQQAQKSGITISGTVREAGKKTPIAYATVILRDKADDQMIDGTTTDDDGHFELHSEHGDFYVELSFMGYLTKKITDFEINGSKLNLGDILFEEDSKTLDEVVIQGERSRTEFQLDKRVFNVGQDISSTGASALDILNNIPSVSVNIEGQISLRGSQGVRILINGKPSVLASEQGNIMGTITADMIERIEVITNPSAKFEAEGTSGIINIVLKREGEKNLNGSVTLNTGMPNNHSLGISLNKRTDKLNLFTQVGVGYRTFPRHNETLSKDLSSNTELHTLSDRDFNEEFYNLILGTDYRINNSTVVSLSGQFAYEKETTDSKNDYTLKNPEGTVADAWSRKEDSYADNPKWQGEFQVKKDFDESGDHSLLASATGAFFRKDQVSDFQNRTILGDRPDALQKLNTDYKEGIYTFKLDYTRPFSEYYELETGTQYVINGVSNDYAVFDRQEGEWIPDPNFTNVFVFDQDVLGLYSTVSREKDKWGAKLGLRFEYTALDTRLEDTGEKNRKRYGDFFPTAHTSYKFSDNYSLQAGYSARIFRPGLWELNPFFALQDNFNIYTGNPNLTPEYTDSYEVTSIYHLDKVSFNLGLYQRITTDVIEEVVTVEDNVSIRKPDNVGRSRTTGAEFNSKYTPWDWATIDVDVNYNAFSRKGSYNEQSFGFSGDRWTSRAMAKFKLPVNFDFEAAWNYESAYETLQLDILENYYLDLGLRKKLLKGKAVMNLSVRDVFASRKYRSVSSGQGLEFNRLGMSGRFFTFGISYGIGKGDAMEFSGQKRF